MRTQTGYIIPAILIVILLVIAGYLTFGIQQPDTNTNTTEIEEIKPTPVVSPRPTSTTPIEQPATTTATTSTEIDIGGEAVIQ